MSEYVELSFADKIKCPKGTISVRFLVRHKDETALDGLKDMLLVVSRDCSAPVDCYSDFGSASKGGDKFKRKQLKTPPSGGGGRVGRHAAW